MREWTHKMRRWMLPTTALGVTAILSVLVLVVWPALQAHGAPQGAPGGAPAPGAGAPPPPAGTAPSAPMGGAPGGMPGAPGGPGGMPGAPGAMPGAPGAMPGGAPGGMPGAPGAMPGAPGGAAVGGAPGAAGPGAGFANAPAPGKGAPMYPYRLNPFTPAEAGAEARGKMPWVRRYGLNWDRYPIGLQVVTLPRPERPALKPPPPPPPAAERILRISSVAWTGGTAIATYETPDGRTGIVKPGDFVGDWQITQILRDRVVVRNRNTGDVQELLLRPRERMPVAPQQPTGFGRPGGGTPTPGYGPVQPGVQPGGPQPGFPQPAAPAGED